MPTTCEWIEVNHWPPDSHKKVLASFEEFGERRICPRLRGRRRTAHPGECHHAPDGVNVQQYPDAPVKSGLFGRRSKTRTGGSPVMEVTHALE